MPEWLILHKHRQEISQLHRERHLLLHDFVEGKINTQDAQVKLQRINLQIQDLYYDGNDDYTSYSNYSCLRT